MLSVSEKYSNVLEREINNHYINRIHFSTKEPEIRIIFSCSIEVILLFDKQTYDFVSLFISNEAFSKASLSKIEFRNSEEHKSILAFVFNITSGNSNPFIYYCEKLLRNYYEELSKQKEDI